VDKTAIVGVLAGLWAVEHGKGSMGVSVVPQRADMVTGSLLDQSAPLHYEDLESALITRIESLIHTFIRSFKNQERRNKSS
jgi:hypothetical protein